MSVPDQLALKPATMQPQRCHILVFAPHPDDAEIHCGGSIAAAVRQGFEVVVVDATRGELSSRGTVEQRQAESRDAAQALGLAARVNLELPDGQLQADCPQQRNAIAAAIRCFQPQQVWTMAAHTAHPDHRALHELSLRALKAAALHNLPQQRFPAHSRCHLLAYEGELALTDQPSLVMSLSAADWQRKRAALACHDSQLKPTAPGEPLTSIAGEHFAQFIEARGRMWGQHAHSAYGEAFYAPLTPLALSPAALIARP